jgi:hypothetical protein
VWLFDTEKPRREPLHGKQRKRKHSTLKSVPFLSATPPRAHDRNLAPPVSLRERWLVLAALILASIAAIVVSARHHAWLYYGDAEAHLHIARRLFDSHRPGLGQLGSVWLPLPHLLLAPFAAIDPWWRSGFAAVIPSALCYLAAALGVYLLARLWLPPLPSAFALAFFALNPNLLYLQTTAMTEPLFLAELVWSVLLLVRWRSALDDPPAAGLRTGVRHLWPLTFTLIAAAWTRYDGWILGFGIWLWMALALQRRRALVRPRFILASFALLAAPVLWMVYNAVYFGDWLDFLRGPYSAAAIEARTSGGIIPPHPGWHNPWVSAVFFWHCSTGDAFARTFLGLFLLAVSLFGLMLLMRRVFLRATPDRDAKSAAALACTLLLWVPLPFYAYSVAWGSVPIFLPDWWPHSWYNTRYGMELLPAFAFTLGLAVNWILAHTPDTASIPNSSASRATQPRSILIAVLACCTLANVGQMIAQRPLVYVEATKNFAARGAYTQTLATALARLHTLDPAALVLVDTSDFPTIIPRAGLTYRQTLNESDKQFFGAALASPATHVGIVLAFDGDAVAEAVRAHPQNLRLLAHFAAPGQPASALYVSTLSPLARAVLSPASR